MNVFEVFKPLTGVMCWGCKRGYGSFITLEFGQPSLVIREPVAHGAAPGSLVGKRLQRRRVTVVGDWHLWIESARWRVEVGDQSVESVDLDPRKLDDCLDTLSGQILQQVDFDGSSLEIVWTFDGGGQLSARPEPMVDGDCWSLFNPKGVSVTFRSDGNLEYENS
jgi:hypothetical protein